MPPLSVQPLVENAVKHGICTRVEGGTVTIRSREEADAYVVEVEDDGVGFDPEELEQRQAWGGAEHKYTHIGLANIRFRVEELAGGSLAVASQPGKGTLVTVRFPKTEGMAEKGKRRYMRVIIVDDERLALRQFEMETEDMPGVEVAGAFTNPVDALRTCRSTRWRRLSWILPCRG